MKFRNIGKKKLKFTDKRLSAVNSHKVDALSSNRKVDLFGSSALLSGGIKAGPERFKAHGLHGMKSLHGTRALHKGRMLTSLLDASVVSKKKTKLKERLKRYAHERHDEQALKKGKPVKDEDDYGLMKYYSEWKDTMISRKKVKKRR